VRYAVGSSRRVTIDGKRLVQAQEKARMDVKYPNVVVKDFGRDGNAFALMGQVSGAMRRAGIDQKEIDAFHEEATAGDYDHLIQTCLKWADCKYCGDNDEDEDCCSDCGDPDCDGYCDEECEYCGYTDCDGRCED